MYLSKTGVSFVSTLASYFLVSGYTLCLPAWLSYKAICGNWEVNNPFQMLCSKWYEFFFSLSTGIIWEDKPFFFFLFSDPQVPTSIPFLCLVVVLENALVMNCCSSDSGLLWVVGLSLCNYVFICRRNLRVPSVTTFYSNANFHLNMGSI